MLELLLAFATLLFESSVLYVNTCSEYSDTWDRYFFPLFPQNIAKYLKNWQYLKKIDGKIFACLTDSINCVFSLSVLFLAFKNSITDSDLTNSMPAFWVWIKTRRGCTMHNVNLAYRLFQRFSIQFQMISWKEFRKSPVVLAVATNNCFTESP